MLTKIVAFMLWISINCYSQKFHIVYRGPCLDKESDFCQSQVPNSFCSPTANECFCRNGYASIKEFNRIVCKTLLTDIICRGDHHCLHVKDSVCHPGAMRCTCPAETIYVPQKHTCMTKYVGQSSESCKLCRQNDGECYVDKSITRSPSIQCRCPNNRINIEYPRGVNHYTSLCSGLAVDIGHYCDGKRILCKSERSKCTANAMGLHTCQCPKTYVPIYQEQLNYFECFRKAEYDDSKACQICRSSEGQCYVRDGYGNKYGCKCSNLDSNLFINNKEKHLNFSSKSCLAKYVSISCWSNSITVCLLLGIRYYVERVRSGHSLAFVGTDKSNFGNFSTECIMNSRVNMDKRYDVCAHIQIDSPREMPCGMNSIRYSDGVLFKGQMQFWYDKYSRDVSRDLLIDFSCKNKRNQHKGMSGSTVDRSSNLQFSTSYSILRKVHFGVKNLSGETARVVKKDDVLQMEIEINKSVDDFQSINIEKCSLEATSTQSSSNRSKINLIISAPHECSYEDNSTFQRLIWNQINPPSWKKLKSEFFTLHNMDIQSNTKVHIYCAYTICKERGNCVETEPCSKVVNSNIGSRFSETMTNISSPMRLIMSTVELSFVSDPINHIFHSKPKTTRLCDDSICLTDVHMWLISFFCLICIISLTSVIMCLWRKIHNRTMHHYDVSCNKPDILLQNPALFINKLPITSNIHSSCTVEYEENNITTTNQPHRATFVSNNESFINNHIESISSDLVDLEKLKSDDERPYYGVRNNNYLDQSQFHMVNTPMSNSLICHCLGESLT